MLKALIHQGGLQQRFNVSGSRRVGTNGARNITTKNSRRLEKNVRSRLQKGTAETQASRLTVVDLDVDVEVAVVVDERVQDDNGKD